MSPRRRPALTEPLLALAALALGQAVHFFARRPLSFALLTLTLAAAALALWPPKAWDAHVARRVTPVLLGLGILWQLFELALFTPILRPDHAGRIRVLLAAAAVVIAAEVAGIARGARLRLPALVALHIVLGVWIIGGSPQPFIDVYTWHVEAFRALGQGQSPYGITMPNIYGHEAFYGPGLVVDGRVQFGFPYPPLSLLVASAGHLLGGDYRFANLAAMGLAALLIGTCRPGRLAPLAAALFLFTPRTFFVLEQGWTEPYVVLMLAATVWCACRAPALTPLALGLLLAIKQYTLVAAPLALLLYPGSWREAARVLLKAALGAAVITLPFVLADPAGFVRSVVVLQFRQPFRGDSLSYAVVWARATGLGPPPGWPAFVLLAVALVACVRRAVCGPAGFAASTAFALIVFFAFSKQAFVNYYFFGVGALCCALAAAAPEPPADPA